MQAFLLEVGSALADDTSKMPVAIKGGKHPLMFDNIQQKLLAKQGAFQPQITREWADWPCFAAELLNRLQNRYDETDPNYEVGQALAATD